MLIGGMLRLLRNIRRCFSVYGMLIKDFAMLKLLRSGESGDIGFFY